MAGFAIRPGREADLPVVADLAHRIWPEAYKDVLSEAQTTNLLERIYSIGNLRSEALSGHRFWIAYEGSLPLGFSSAYKEKGIIWLKKLYVLKERAGQGIGKALMDAATDGFRPASEQRLLVNDRNFAAHRFYERVGFTRAGETPVRMGDYDFTDFIYARRLN